MLCPEELAIAVTVTAISISKNLSPADTDLLSAVFMQLGDTLATIAAAKAKAEQCIQENSASNGSVSASSDISDHTNK